MTDATFAQRSTPLFCPRSPPGPERVAGQACRLLHTNCVLRIAMHFKQYRTRTGLR
jgi:hypothetical protein